LWVYYMSGMVDSLVQINCTYKKVTSFVFGILGVLSLVCALMNMGYKSAYTGSATGTLSNVVSERNKSDGHTMYTMNITYQLDGKSVTKKTLTNKPFTDGQTVPILYNPKTGEAVIKSEYTSPSLFIYISIPILLCCVVMCAVTFYMTTTEWGCKMLAFSSLM
jgi:hypothetical protein